MFEPSYIEISKSALENNLQYMRKRIGKDVVFSSVIKGNAYGHGIEHFLPIAEKCGVNHFSVYSAHEALRAYRCKQNDDTHIMIMGIIDNDELEWAIEKGVSFFVFDPGRVKAAVKAAKKVGKKARIHIELETGFHRTGFEDRQLDELVEFLKGNEDSLEIEGICTHYAGAESISNYVRVKTQIEKFNESIKWFSDRGIKAKYHHTACSAAVLNYPETIMDLVRVGIAQYGYWPNRETYMRNMKSQIENVKELNNGIKDPLDRIISWKSKVMNIKNVEPGEFVGYGTSYFTSRTERLAGVPVGYAHGFSRSQSNVGTVLIHGQRANVVGYVNMNVMMVDVTDIPDVKKDDEVVMIGYQGEDSITVSSFSEASNHLNYELLTRLPEDIPRRIVE